MAVSLCYFSVGKKRVRGRKNQRQPSEQTKSQTSDGAKIFVETVSGLFILEIPQETFFFKCFGFTPRQRLDLPKSPLKYAKSWRKSSGATPKFFGVTYMFSSMAMNILASLENNQSFYSIADFFVRFTTLSFTLRGKIQRFIPPD